MQWHGLGSGITTQIINGGVKCGGTVEVAQSLNRISYYCNFAVYLGVSVYPDGNAYACQLVGYQTPFSAFKKEDFTQCVRKHSPNIEIDQ